MEITSWQKALMDAGELYRVGGSVRDELLGLEAEGTEEVDFLVRCIEPGELEDLLRAYGRLELVGKSFGVYKFKPTGGERVFDLAYPRRERSTGVGHRDFAVSWDPDLAVEDDLRRRDFTINAIARRVGGDALIDPCDGRRDIAERRLRMIFEAAFEDDPLRILRGVRFAARFALEVEESTAEAMRRGAALLSTLSPERVQEELTRTLTQCARPSEAFDLMHGIDALAVVLPELDRGWGIEQNEHHPDDVFWHSVKSCDAAPRNDLLVRWAALLHDLGKVDQKQSILDDNGIEHVVFYGHEEVSARIAREVLARLRYANSFVETCAHLVAHHMFHYESQWTDATVRRFIHRVGGANLDALFALRAADCGSRHLSEELVKLNELRRRVHGEIEKAQAFKVEDLAIGGREVMRALDIGPGQMVGEILQALLEIVIENPSMNRRDELLRIVRDRFG